MYERGLRGGMYFLCVCVYERGLRESMYFLRMRGVYLLCVCVCGLPCAAGMDSILCHVQACVLSFFVPGHAYVPELYTL